MAENKHIFQFTAEQEATALSLLQQTELSSSVLKQAASEGSVWLEGSKQKPRRLRRLKQILQPGDTVWLYYNESILNKPFAKATLILDRQDYSIWCKPRGMFSQPSKWSDANSIGRFASQQLDRACYLVHRLDRMTTGLMIVSHKRSLVHEFTQRFSEQAIKKTYCAIIEGTLEASPVTIATTLDDKPAETTVWSESCATDNRYTMARVNIASGRKHQIRRHLASIGHPVLGDRLYGEPQSQHELQLYAVKLEFICPMQQESVMVELPEDMYLRELQSHLSC